MNTNFQNIINKDGTAIYFGVILNIEESLIYMNRLSEEINWEPEKLIMFGKEITTKRKVAFYADNNIQYTYSNKTKKGATWTPMLIEIKKVIESYTKTTYNACLLNLYHNGDEGMGWHSDDEKEIKSGSSIASLSIGAERKFLFKHKTTKETISHVLQNGALLEMKGAIQQHWLHALPKTKKVNDLRINLTFRQMSE